jgi:hypothetical protein
MVQTYNEFKVTFDDKGKIIEKNLTKRGTVRISEFTANVNNSYTDSTKLLYELAKKEEPPKEKTDQRKALEAKAKELKVKFNPKLGDVKLLERIVKIDPEFKVENK